MTPLRLPVLHASPFVLLRAGLRWLRRNGETVAAREPVAYSNIGLRTPRGLDQTAPFSEESSDLQVALAPSHAGVLRSDASLSQGGFQDVVSLLPWDDGTVIGSLEASTDAELVPLILVGRRGLDAGEGRGELLSGWHDRTRAFWGVGSGPTGTLLSLGICEQTPLFRGEDFAYLEWFARARGPAQVMSIPDERTVHSSAVLLQQLRRTPAEAAAIADAVHGWIGERLVGSSASFPAFDTKQPSSPGRWPDGQSVLFALNLLNEALGPSPLLERTDLLGSSGCAEAGPPDVVSLSLGAEFTSHYRHKKSGWLIALHDYRLSSFVGPAIIGWLRRDFERVPRSVAEVGRDLAALTGELKARTGGVLVVQNLISTAPTDRIPNYSWLGDSFSSAVPVMCAEANLMLANLTQDHDLSVLDSDALVAEHGGRHCPDRAHPDRVLLEAQRGELHSILRARKIPGFEPTQLE